MSSSERVKAAVSVLQEASIKAEDWAKRHWDVVVYLAHTEGEWEWIPDKVDVFDSAERAYRDAEQEARAFVRAAELLALQEVNPNGGE
jgi:hypothetical protein